MIDYMVLEGANGYSVAQNDNAYPLTTFDIQVDQRNEEQPKPEDHGLWPSYNYMGKMTVHVEGDILGNDASDYWRKRLALTSVFTPVPELGFQWVVRARVKFTGIAEETVALCALDGSPDIPMNAQVPAMSHFTYSLKSFDPRWYGSTVQLFDTGLPVVQGGFIFPLTFPLQFITGSVGGDAFLINAGNANTNPTVLIYGPCSEPELTQFDAAQNANTLQFQNLHIKDGDYIAVDFGDRTVTSSGGNNLYNYVTADSDWWFLVPGVNHVKFTALNAAGNCHAEFQWQNAYML